MLVPWLRLITAGAAVMTNYSTRPPTISLPNGATITGTLEIKPARNAVQVFRGIPYAEPPIGDKRWKPSTVKRPSGHLNATAYGSTCLGVSTSPQSTEDCLFLNVYAPAGATKLSKFPVMVWIHGGALLNGESNSFDSHTLVAAADKKLVVVTLNYRLGVFGFLSSKQLLAEGNGANFGLRDQETAFQWVKKYIQHFGGNPNDITAFGESAGAWSVGHHLISRDGDQKLFHRAILESGAYSTVHDTAPPAVQQSKADTLAKDVGCSDAKDIMTCLRKADATVLTTIKRDDWRGFPWMPTIDGVFLKDTAIRRLRAGKVSRVPTIIGSNTDEGWMATSWVTPQTDFDAFLHAQFSMLTDAEYARITALYPASLFITLRHRMSEIYGDAIFVCPTELLSETQASGHTYRYRFNYPVVVSGYPVVDHGSDVVYVFNKVGDIPESDKSRTTIAQYFQTFWTTFARTGSPNGRDHQQQQQTPVWPRFTAATKQQLVLQPTLAVEVMGTNRAGHEERCAFWLQVEQRIANEVAFA